MSTHLSTLTVIASLSSVWAFPVQEPKYSTRGQGSQQEVKLKKLYKKNKIDITVYSEMHVLTLCCRESQVKITEEQWKSDLSATCDMPWPSLPRLCPWHRPSVFYRFIRTGTRRSESQLKIAEEQCKSELSSSPTCNMPWPR